MLPYPSHTEWISNPHSSDPKRGDQKSLLNSNDRPGPNHRDLAGMLWGPAASYASLELPGRRPMPAHRSETGTDQRVPQETSADTAQLFSESAICQL
jgi:hypothetical protein